MYCCAGTGGWPYPLWYCAGCSLCWLFGLSGSGGRGGEPTVCDVGRSLGRSKGLGGGGGGVPSTEDCRDVGRSRGVEVPSSGGKGGSGGGTGSLRSTGRGFIGSRCCDCGLATTRGSLVKTSRRIERNSRRVGFGVPNVSGSEQTLTTFPHRKCCQRQHAVPVHVPMPTSPRGLLTFRVPLPSDHSAKYG